jgi:CobQ-like glutamine amidotransferase family enzyme
VISKLVGGSLMLAVCDSWCILGKFYENVFGFMVDISVGRWGSKNKLRTEGPLPKRTHKTGPTI